MFDDILVTCVGNICRSPMAEALLKRTLEKSRLSETHISSAGIAALIGHNPTAHACQLMLARGIDISKHSARMVSNEMIHQADLVIVMESAHKALIEEKMPSARGKIFRLGQWGNFDIPDPYKRDFSAYETALDLIDTGIAQWKEKLIK